jgi:hypothetical protein
MCHSLFESILWRVDPLQNHICVNRRQYNSRYWEQLCGHAIMEAMFSVQSVPLQYIEGQLSLEGVLSQSSRVEGSNTSTVALRVVGGDEKEPSAWGYNRATLILGI